MKSHILTVVAIASIASIPATPAHAQETAAATAQADSLATASLPLEPTREIRFTTSEGSWISVDISPDGATLVFDLLGDLYTRWDVRPLLEKQAARIIQPDICHAGGILELKKIAAMAETYYVSVQPHNSNGPLSTVASLHLDACIPNVQIQEFFYPYLERYNQVLTEPIEYRDGYLTIPQGPGLGTDIDEEAIRRYPPMKIPQEATWMGSYW